MISKVVALEVLAVLSIIFAVVLLEILDATNHSVHRRACALRAADPCPLPVLFACLLQREYHYCAMSRSRNLCRGPFAWWRLGGGWPMFLWEALLCFTTSYPGTSPHSRR